MCFVYLEKGQKIISTHRSKTTTKQNEVINFIRILDEKGIISIEELKNEL